MYSSLEATHANLIVGKSLDNNIYALPLNNAFFCHPNFYDNIRLYAAFSLAVIYDKVNINNFIDDFAYGLQKVSIIKKIYGQNTVFLFHLK